MLGRLKDQSTATAQLKARTLELEHREQLLDKVFDAACGTPARCAGPEGFCGDHCCDCFGRPSLSCARALP